jgi:regulator of sigma E protease
LFRKARPASYKLAKHQDDHMGLLGGWLGLILGFSGLIFIHELGHFALAKWNGVRVYVFSLGMGPYIFSFSWRGTVYALSLIPIGGYVKLAGQDDMNPNPEPSKDPTDYRNKKPGQRAAILAAGAIFNLIFTIVAFTICYSVGMDMEPPKLGLIYPDKPLGKAKLQADGKPANLQEGDRIIEVNGVPVKSFLEAMLQISGTPRGDDLQLCIERPGIGRSERMYVKVETQHDKKIGAPGIGLNPYIMDVKLPLGFATETDVVLFENPSEVEGFKNLPAGKEGDFKVGDLIVSVGGKKVTRIEDMLLAGPLSKGEKTTIVLKRGDQTLVKDLTPVKSEETESYVFGLRPRETRRVTALDPNSEAAKAGLKVGDYVFGFRPDEERWDASGKLIWEKGELEYASDWKADGKDVKKIRLNVPESGDVSMYFSQGRQGVEHYKAGTFGEALSMAWGDTIRFSGSVFTVLRGLFTGDVSPGALSGGIGIGYAVFKVASNQTFMKFLWFLGFISLNLGVLQFVPIPLLDGWHLLMILVEKLKGSPVAPKIQEAFQYVGLFIVGSLIILATYNDIYRIFVK